MYLKFFKSACLIATFVIFLVALFLARPPNASSNNAVPAEGEYTGNVVKINGRKGRWKLLVNGKEFSLKGAGAGRSRDREGKTDHLKLARELGANIVRTWGVDQGTQEYLDTAWRYGLYVDAGLWLNPVGPAGECSYVRDAHYRKKVREEVLSYVQRNMNHPAVLFWNIGNEVIYWTKSERERVAFCRFLEELIQEVHRLDPHHPVIYASAFGTAIDYIKKYVPSLDIIGINAYGGLDQIHRQVTAALDIPYLFTEYGPPGPWDSGQDTHGKPYERTDKFKAAYYLQYARQISSFKGHCLGGFIFIVGDTSDTSLTWWNINYKQYKKLSYLLIQNLYRGEGEDPPAPLIKRMILSKRKALRPRESFEIRLEVEEAPDTQTRYEYFASTDIYWPLAEYPNRRIPMKVEGEGTAVKACAPSAPGIYRVYAAALASNLTASTLSQTISVK